MNNTYLQALKIKKKIFLILKIGKISLYLIQYLYKEIVALFCNELLVLLDTFCLSHRQQCYVLLKCTYLISLLIKIQHLGSGNYMSKPTHCQLEFFGQIHVSLKLQNQQQQLLIKQTRVIWPTSQPKDVKTNSKCLAIFTPLPAETSEN